MPSGVTFEIRTRSFFIQGCVLCTYDGERVRIDKDQFFYVTYEHPYTVVTVKYRVPYEDEDPDFDEDDVYDEEDEE
jgi:hypothetical protein